MAALVAEDVFRAVGAESGSHDHLEGDQGSRLSDLVRRGESNSRSSCMLCNDRVGAFAEDREV